MTVLHDSTGAVASCRASRSDAKAGAGAGAVPQVGSARDLRPGSPPVSPLVPARWQRCAGDASTEEVVMVGGTRKSVVVGLDRSEAGRAAVEHAAELAVRRKAPLRLVRAYE